MYVVGVLGGGIARPEICSPTDSRHPNLSIPNDVEHTERLGIGLAPGGEPGAVRLVVAGRGATKATLGRGEVARPAAGMLTKARRAPTVRVPGEASELGLNERVIHARCDLAGGLGRILDRLGLPRPTSVRVAGRRLRVRHGAAV